MSITSYRMGYAAPATAAAAATVEISGEKKASVGQVVSNSTPTEVGASDVSASPSSWMPDPVTGYYRPGNRRKETEAAELQATRLSYELWN